MASTGGKGDTLALAVKRNKIGENTFSKAQPLNDRAGAPAFGPVPLWGSGKGVACRPVLCYHVGQIRKGGACP